VLPLLFLHAVHRVSLDALHTGLEIAATNTRNSPVICARACPKIDERRRKLDDLLIGILYRELQIPRICVRRV
jgi:hypothetical protein